MKKFRWHKVGHLVMFLVVVAGLVAILMLLWNSLIPEIFGWSDISYSQAAGLLVLCRLLFGGFGKFHPAMGNPSHRLSFKMHEKMKNMSRNERREFILRRMGSMEDKASSLRDEE